MPLRAQLSEDLKVSLKAGEKLRVETIRFLIADLQNKEIILKRGVEDAEVIDIIASQIKKRKESIVEFTKGNRPELAKKTEAEIVILLAYLPPQLGAEEIKKLINDIVVKTGAQGPKDMGKVMGQLLPLVKGKADNRLVSDLVKERLA